VEQLKLELGLPGGLFGQDLRRYSLLGTGRWIRHTWQFLWENSVSILDRVPDLVLRREGDRFLIPAFAGSGFARRDLLQLNRCRLFLQVTTLADIVQGNGSAWNGKRDSFRPHFYEWPIQSHPPQSDWEKWKRALTVAFGVHPSSRLLSSPLGHWTDDISGWRWFWSPSEERLYEHCKNDEWCFFPRLPGRASRLGTSKFTQAPSSTNSTDLPLDLA
jgi:hypothetical protein